MEDYLDPAGSSFESFLEEAGIRDEVYGAAIKAVLARQFENALVERNLNKSALAKKMQTSRTQVQRVLDPGAVSVSLETLDRAAAAMGKRLEVRLVDEN